MDSDGNLIKVGYISGFYGVKGWLKVFSYTDPKENILAYRPWMVKIPQQGWQEIKLLGGRLQGKGIVAQLEGFNNKNQVLHLLKAEIAIRQDQLPACDDGEYYWRDLMGFDVVTDTGKNIGTVKGVMETGANDVMEVKGTDGGETLIPWVHDVYIKQVDQARQKIIVDWEQDDS